MLLIILYIKIVFWYVTLSGSVCQLSPLSTSEDGIYISRLTQENRFSYHIHTWWQRNELIYK